MELGLPRRAALRLAEEVRGITPGADPAHLPFYRVALLALEVGRWHYAAAGEPAGPERGRRLAALQRYRRALGAALAELRRERPGPRRGAGAPGTPEAGGGREAPAPVSPGEAPCPGSAPT